jgi:tetratricopeptide (TPR) repeat protein
MRSRSVRLFYKYFAMKKTFCFYACLFIACLYSSVIMAQQGALPPSVSVDYDRGIELFNKQKFGAARQYFDKVAANTKGTSTLRADASKYLSFCATELQNDDAESIFSRYAAAYEWHSGVNDAAFRLGSMFYNQKQYRKACTYLAKVKPEGFNADKQAEYYFFYGYSSFMQNDLDKAKVCLYEIKDKDSRYTSPAIYYYSHIAYTEKNYQTAINGFEKLKTDETFGSLVPYYITQCLYMQGKYEELVKYAPPLIDSVVSGRTAEMSKLIGDAYYRLNKYGEAIPFLERFAKEATPTITDNYQLGYCYYNEKRFTDAIPQFEYATGTNDALAQNALFHLGDCYLRTNEKKKALLAFSRASKMDFDARMKEDALFNFAVLTYETGYNPFNEALKAFNEFLEKYPNSARTDEVYQYMVAAYMNTHNYKEAMASIEKIKVKDNNIKKAMQRVAFYHGLELYNDQRYQEALVSLEKSLLYADFDRALGARASYWIAESNYRMADFDEAINEYDRFLTSAGAFSLPEYKLAHYNMGYAYFSKKDYPKAQEWFRKYIGFNSKYSQSIMSDAYNRTADCYFIQTQYQPAIDNYSKSIEIGKADKDYAMFQKAFCLGLLGKHKQKITLLADLMKQSPKSAYMDDALYESGKSYVELDDDKQAISYFKKLITSYPKGSYVPKSWLQLGLIAYNDHKNTEAIDCYKKIVDEWPGCAEYRSALTGIKNIYVEDNNVEAYIQYTDNLAGFNVSQAEQDTLSFRAAENIYMAGDCTKATDGLDKYITRFPKGSFILNAHYYRGDCAMRNNKTTQALEDFTYVSSQSRNEFSEEALLNSARLLMDTARYAEALDAWKKLETVAEQKANIFESKVGQLRAYGKLNEHSNVLAAAKIVLASENINPEISREATFLTAKASQALTMNEQALTNYKKVAVDVKTIEGAESEYRVCELLFATGKDVDGEKEVFRFADLNTPHQYWMAKSFLALATNYVKLKDDFQASQTLQSVIDNYGNKTDGIIDEAKKQLADINTAKEKEPGYQPKEIELKINR